MPSPPFLNERGCIERRAKRGRDYFRITPTLYGDTMTEYHALEHRGLEPR